MEKNSCCIFSQPLFWYVTGEGLFPQFGIFGQMASSPIIHVQLADKGNPM